jgi:hypothetical protein
LTFEIFALEKKWGGGWVQLAPTPYERGIK